MIQPRRETPTSLLSRELRRDPGRTCIRSLLRLLAGNSALLKKTLLFASSGSDLAHPNPADHANAKPLKNQHPDSKVSKKRRIVNLSSYDPSHHVDSCNAKNNKDDADAFPKTMTSASASSIVAIPNTSQNPVVEAINMIVRMTTFLQFEEQCSRDPQIQAHVAAAGSYLKLLRESLLAGLSKFGGARFRGPYSISMSVVSVNPKNLNPTNINPQNLNPQNLNHQNLNPQKNSNIINNITNNNGNKISNKTPVSQECPFPTKTNPTMESEPRIIAKTGKGTRGIIQDEPFSTQQQQQQQQQQQCAFNREQDLWTFCQNLSDHVRSGSSDRLEDVP